MPYTPDATDVNQPVDTVDRSTAAAEFRTLKTYIAGLITAFVPKQAFTGEIKIWSGKVASIPAGWMIVPTVATNISRVTYADLHTFMQASGYPYGVGDGSTTFGIPFIKPGYSILPAVDDTEVATESVGEVLSHTHRSKVYLGGVGGSGGSPVRVDGVFADDPGVIEATGGTANLAAGLKLYYIIKT